MDHLTATLFGQSAIDDTTNLLARHMPTGRAWDLKADSESNIYKLIASLAAAVNDIQQIFTHIISELDIEQAQDLLPEWEASVGLPDECISTYGLSFEDRRNAVILRLRRYPVVTKEDYEALAAQFGVTMEIVYEVDITGYPLDYPLTYEISYKKSRFIIRANVSAGWDKVPLLQCLFARIIPATDYIEFIDMT
jgi:uncharacterized protein YmfQ (DUF2313 family)